MGRTHFSEPSNDSSHMVETKKSLVANDSVNLAILNQVAKLNSVYIVIL